MGGNHRKDMVPQAQLDRNDGIGDLEFNDDLSYNAAEPNPVMSNILNPPLANKPRGNPLDGPQSNRTRANSLAFPGLLLEGGNADEISFGQWIDADPHAISIPSSTGQHSCDPPQISSECDVLMASKLSGKSASSRSKKLKVKKERAKKTSSASNKEKKEPRERKSQSKMNDMMESICNTPTAVADSEETREVPSGLGQPRSMGDPNLTVRLDEHGLLRVNGPSGWVGAYSPDSRQIRINRFLEKRNHRVWVKKVKYDVRKNFADSRLRVKGRFVKKEDEMLMRELMSLT